MRQFIHLIFSATLLLGCSSNKISKQKTTSGNPIFEGWYADPEARIFGKTCWIYPTFSDRYDRQVHFDAFSSPDLVNWTKHPRILDTTAVRWAKAAMWAPSVVENGGKYYFFFGANDIQNDSELGGIGVVVSDRPDGGFRDYLGKPLVDKFHNGAQPIDQFVFKDVDGQFYLIYGGWRHCNIARLNWNFTGFTPFDDGSTFREITPEGYVEGSFMFLKNGKYYFMWSEGGWTGPDYSVAYAMADSPLGPFKRIGKILQQDARIATGAGHHSVVQLPGTDDWYIVYHRRPLGETDGNSRQVCIENLHFDENGLIKPVALTREGVKKATPKNLSPIDEYVVEIFEDSKNNLWFGTLNKGVARFDGKNLTNFSEKEGLVGNAVTSVAEDRAGNLWFGTQSGLSKFDGKNFTNFKKKDGLCHEIVSNLLVDKSGKLWVGTWGGVCQFDGGKFSNFELPKPAVELKAYNNATENWITEIIEDQQGNIWFGRDGYGACRFDGKNFTHFTKKEGLASNNVQVICADKRGNIWFGSRVAERDHPDRQQRQGDGGLSCFDGKNVIQFPEIEGLSKNETYAIAEDRAGNVWIGANGLGVYRFDGRSFQLFKGTDRMDLTYVMGIQSILGDGVGRLWFGFSGGLFRLEGGAVVHVSQDWF